MKIKRLLVLALAIIMVFSICGCSGGKSPVKGSDNGVGQTGKIDIVKEGTTPVEEGLNLKGKTVTYAIGLPLSDTMQRQLVAFQNKYGCKVETDLLGFQDYVQILASRMAGGKTYDIIQLEGLRFPSIAISQFVTPLENVITTADWNTGDPTKGGFNEDESSYFMWNNHLYAVVCAQGEFSSKPGLTFYNKKIIEEAGGDDPRELYEKGKWDYDAFKKLGELIAKNTNARICNLSYARSIVSASSAYIYDFSDPHNPKANLTSAEYINNANTLQEFTSGSNPIVGIEGYGDDTATAFFDGKVAFHGGSVYDLYDNHCIGKGVESSNAFDKSLDNLGIVPGPTRSAGDMRHASSWLYGIAAGDGTSDARIAMAFAKHSATFSTINNNAAYKYSEADKKLINKLAAEKKKVNAYCFSDGSNTDYLLVQKLQWEIAEGGDVAQLVATYNAQLQNCIDVMMAQ